MVKAIVIDLGSQKIQEQMAQADSNGAPPDFYTTADLYRRLSSGADTANFNAQHMQQLVKLQRLGIKIYVVNSQVLAAENSSLLEVLGREIDSQDQIALSEVCCLTDDTSMNGNTSLYQVQAISNDFTQQLQDILYLETEKDRTPACPPPPRHNVWSSSGSRHDYRMFCRSGGVAITVGLGAALMTVMFNGTGVLPMPVFLTLLLLSCAVVALGIKQAKSPSAPKEEQYPIHNSI